jgi:hypothetical protein
MMHVISLEHSEQRVAMARQHDTMNLPRVGQMASPPAPQRALQHGPIFVPDAA